MQLTGQLPSRQHTMLLTGWFLSSMCVTWACFVVDTSATVGCQNFYPRLMRKF